MILKIFAKIWSIKKELQFNVIVSKIQDTFMSYFFTLGSIINLKII